MSGETQHPSTLARQLLELLAQSDQLVVASKRIAELEHEVKLADMSLGNYQKTVSSLVDANKDQKERADKAEGESRKWEERCLLAEEGWTAAIARAKAVLAKEGIDPTVDPWKEAERLRAELADARNELQQVLQRAREEERALCISELSRLAEAQRKELTGNPLTDGQYQGIRSAEKVLREMGYDGSFEVVLEQNKIMRRLLEKARRMLLGLPNESMLGELTKGIRTCLESQ